MNQFIELKGGKIISLHVIKCVVKDRDKIVIVTTKGFNDEVVDVNFKKLAHELHKHGFSVITELVGKGITELINDDGVAYQAVINMNLVAGLIEGWQGKIQFLDGSTIESNFSYGAVESQLVPTRILLSDYKE